MNIVFENVGGGGPTYGSGLGQTDIFESFVDSQYLTHVINGNNILTNQASLFGGYLIQANTIDFPTQFKVQLNGANEGNYIPIFKIKPGYNVQLKFTGDPQGSFIEVKAVNPTDNGNPGSGTTSIPIYTNTTRNSQNLLDNALNPNF